MRASAWMVVCLIGLSAVEAQAQLQSRVVVTGLQQPLGFVQDPTDRLVQFVLEKGGRIRIIRDGVLQPNDFINLTGQVARGQEQGLLGLAFAPDYAQSGRFFINYTDLSDNTIISRYRRSASNPLAVDPGSRFDLRFGNTQRYIDRPAQQHNGGNLAFGPDGYLYIGLGDGSVSNDPDHAAQNGNELLGKMLRIDVNVPDDDERGYRIPPDNPFLNHPARDEIWAFGLRNPWRYSFDDPTKGGTGALIIADVGQSHYEEINYEPRGKGGRNYGWRNREGKHSNEDVEDRPVAFQPLTDPIYDYPRSVGRSITGGFVYRGRRLGEGYRGRYFFADYVMGRVWSLGLAIDGAGEATATDLREHTAELGGRSVFGAISSIGVDTDGELYLVNLGNAAAPASIIMIDGPPVSPPDPTGFKVIKK